MNHPPSKTPTSVKAGTTMALDLASLTVTDSDEDLTRSRASGAGRPKIDNPFHSIILDSWNNSPEDSQVGTTKVLVVTNDAEIGKANQPKNVTTILGLIRRAADDEGLGVRIVTVEHNANGKPPAEGKRGTQTTIKFAAKVKTERKRKADKVDVAPEPSSY